MDGHKAEIKEMLPLTIIKSIDRVNINTDRLETDGTIEWQEAYGFDVIDDTTPLLDQIITIPNPSMFTTIIASNGNRVSADAILYTLAAVKFYHTFQELINNRTSHLPFTDYFAGKTRISFPTLVRDQYRSGLFTRAVGEILASPACRILVPIVAEGIQSSIPAETAVPILCHDGYRDNIGISAFSVLLRPMGFKISPSDAPFFYEFEKGCKEHSKFPSQACYLKDVCNDEGDYDACIEPSLSELDAKNLFDFFHSVAEKLSIPARIDEGKASVVEFLTNGCRLGGRGARIRSAQVCSKIHQQLMRVGRAAAIGMNPKRKDLLKAYGWGSNGLDLEIGAKVVPYFIKGTIRDLMGFGISKPRKDPLTGTPLGLNKWINSILPNGGLSDFISQPIRQQFSSRFSRVPNKFISVGDRKFSCAFDYGCMQQKTFISTSGKSCDPEPNACAPVFIEGTDVGYSGTSVNMFGMTQMIVPQTTEKKDDTLFMPEFFLNAKFQEQEINVPVGDEGLRVNKWKLTGLTNNRFNCHQSSHGSSRGIDCDSPIGSMNLGYHLTYEIKRASPLFMHLPLYASFPHFVNPDFLLPPASGDGVTYNPTEKISITECAGCRDTRAGKDEWYQTELWTEPETGAHVFGSQKLQLNVRVMGNTSQMGRNSRRAPMSHDGDVDTGGIVFGKNVDVLVPLFWANKFDEIAPFQATKLVALQGLPRKLNVMFAMLLLIAVVGIVAGGMSIYKALKLRKQLAMKSSIMIRSITGKGISTNGDENERASTVFSCDGIGRVSGNESDESAPRTLTPV